MVFVVLPHHSYYRYFYPLTTVVMWLGATKNRTFNAEKPPFGAVFLKKGGPSDRIRTCGILLPKQARYQLRYTRLLSYSIRLGVFTQMSRATNCTTPGYLVVMIIARKSCDLKFFPVCGHSCGQSRFCAAFGNRCKSSKHRRHKTLRRFASPYPGYNHGTPKAGALPTALHPDTVFTLHRKSVFDSPNSILDFGRKVNRPVA